MSCPFAPLLGMFPFLVMLFKSTVTRIKRAKELAIPRLSSVQIDEAKEYGAMKAEGNQMKFDLPDSTLNTFEFYPVKAPHIRLSKALHSESITGGEFLLFDKEACSEKARQTAEIFEQAGIGRATIKNSELNINIRDIEEFEQYGAKRFIAEVREVLH